MSANFKPTTAEYSLVNQIFAQNDPQKLGILTGDVAVRVFGGAKLPGAVLGEVWSIVDKENNGWLSRKGVAMALRLMAHAQKGEKVSPTLLDKRTCASLLCWLSLLTHVQSASWTTSVY
jgi:epidermal growth factor receptor substrate 15